MHLFMIYNKKYVKQISVFQRWKKGYIDNLKLATSTWENTPMTCSLALSQEEKHHPELEWLQCVLLY